jgi:leader peptidase (prepilin peptidase)/N-methyltransferase
MTPEICAFLLGGLGLIAGSFIGLVSLRLPRGEGVVAGRSRCGGCGRPLPPWRLVPLLSWLAARGRCRDCGARIPIRYPLIEAGCGLIGVGAALSQPDLTAAAITALLGWQLLLIAIVDGENFWLPDQLTLPLLASGLAARLWLDPADWTGPVIGIVAGFGVLWTLAVVYRRVRNREGLGGGDPILLAAGGAWVGWIGLPSVLIWASVGGLSVVAALMLTGRPVSGSDRMPFGVYLALGIALTWLLGPLGLPG